MVNFQDPHPPCPATSKIIPPLDLGRPKRTRFSLQIITNQFKENIIQIWLLHVIRSFLLVGFCSQYQLINLVWLSIDFYPFSWSQPRPRSYFKKLKISFSPLPPTAKRYAGLKVELKPHYLLFCDFIFLCMQLSKNITKWFLFIIIQNFSIHFAINLFYLHILNKLWNNNRIVHVNERNQNKNKVMSHSNWPRVL